VSQGIVGAVLLPVCPETPSFDAYKRVTVGSATLAPVGIRDVFMIKLDPSGSPVWAKNIGGSTNDAGRGIFLDASGISYTTGEFSGSMAVGTTSLTAVGGRDVFMIKLDPSGNPVWAQNFGGSSTDTGYGIAVDASGSSYTTGLFRGSMTVGDTTLTAQGENMFVIKLIP